VTKNKYPPAPPEGVEAEPLEPPLQDTFVCAAVAVLIVVGEYSYGKPPFSHSIGYCHSKVPALNPVAVAAVPPDGDQECYSHQHHQKVTEAEPLIHRYKTFVCAAVAAIQ
jgi:hypothetical protein